MSASMSASTRRRVVVVGAGIAGAAAAYRLAADCDVVLLSGPIRRGMTRLAVALAGVEEVFRAWPVAGLALLLAPKSGAALRDELGESWITLRDAVGRRYRELAERAGVELDNLQERIDQAASVVESSASELVDQAAREARQLWADRTRRRDV